MSARGPTPRTGLRRIDDHYSWRQVYHQLGVKIEQHDLTGDRR